MTQAVKSMLAILILPQKNKSKEKKVNCRLHAFQEAVRSLDLKKSATLGLVFLEMSKGFKRKSH